MLITTFESYLFTHVVNSSSPLSHVACILYYLSKQSLGYLQGSYSELINSINECRALVCYFQQIESITILRS